MSCAYRHFAVPTGDLNWARNSNFTNNAFFFFAAFRFCGARSQP
jgi:hypothetical protein